MSKSEVNDLYAFIHDYINQNSMEIMDVIGVLELIKMEIVTDAYSNLAERDEDGD